MIDLFALALSHGLLALAAWRLLQRADLDADPAPVDGADCTGAGVEAGEAARRG